jgi:hypothetical protein
MNHSFQIKVARVLHLLGISGNLATLRVGQSKKKHHTS